MPLSPLRFCGSRGAPLDAHGARCYGKAMTTLHDLHARGLSDAEIGAALGLSLPRARAARVRAGLPANPAPPPRARLRVSLAPDVASAIVDRAAIERRPVAAVARSLLLVGA